MYEDSSLCMYVCLYFSILDLISSLRFLSGPSHSSERMHFMVRFLDSVVNIVRSLCCFQLIILIGYIWLLLSILPCIFVCMVVRKRYVRFSYCIKRRVVG